MRIKFSDNRTMSRSFLFANYVEENSAYDFYCLVTTDMESMGICTFTDIFAVPKDRPEILDYVKRHIYSEEESSYTELDCDEVYLLNLNIFKLSWQQTRDILKWDTEVCFYTSVSPDSIRKTTVKIKETETCL